MEYLINWDEIKSFDDLIEVLKLINLIINDPPKQLVEKNLLIPRINVYNIPGIAKPKKISKREKAIIQSFNSSVTGSSLINIIKNL